MWQAYMLSSAGLINRIFNNTMQRYIFILLLIPFIISTSFSANQITGEQLLEMSLEELMNVTVKTGNITGLALSKTPVSITYISAEDIAITPARNIYDLLEVYVPGVLFVNHYDSPHVGVRGLLVDRNYKFLLLVNGRNMNLKAHNGATSELEMWDLGDIEKIEIIRGPGSVTYGPGAVAGIINITTKKNVGKNDLNIAAKYGLPYNNYGLSVAYSKKIGNDNLYVYTGVQRTEGYKLPTIYGPQIDHVFDYFNPETSINRVPVDYMADYLNYPQIKFNVEYDFLRDWSLQLRYTRQGATQNPALPKGYKQIGYDSLGSPTLSSPINLLQTQDQHFTINLKNESDFNNNFHLSSLLSFSSESYIRQMEWLLTFPKNVSPSWDSVLMFQDLTNLWNKAYDFSESSLLANFIVNKEFSDYLSIAAGFEGSYNHWGPGWGKDRRNFLMGDNGNIISGTDSYIYASKYLYRGVPEGQGYFVGNGWNTFTYSFLCEALYQPLENFSILMSARSDKDTYSKWLFSPRIAFISKLMDNNILKLVIQQSQRMNTSSQLLIQHLTGTETKPETLNGIELIYSGLLKDNWLINASAFYNNLDIISWYEVGRTTKPTGNLDVFGIELESKFIFDNLDITINQSIVKQLDWKLADSVFFSGISYSDYYLNLNNLAFSSSGNDLSNWANFATKLIVNYKLINNKLILHLDSRVFWGFEGEKEGVNSFKAAMDPSHPDYLKMVEILRVIEATDMYGIDFRVNFSLGYFITENFKLSAYAMNIFGYGDYKRYSYDSGIKKTSNYFRGSFIEEPTALFLQFDFYY